MKSEPRFKRSSRKAVRSGRAEAPGPKTVHRARLRHAPDEDRAAHAVGLELAAIGYDLLAAHCVFYASFCVFAQLRAGRSGKEGGDALLRAQLAYQRIDRAKSKLIAASRRARSLLLKIQKIRYEARMERAGKPTGAGVAVLGRKRSRAVMKRSARIRKAART